MKIAVSSERPVPESPMDSRFGRARYFMIFDDESSSWESLDNDQNLSAPQGAGIQSAANVVNAGCKILISGNCGPKAFTALSKAGVEVYLASNGTVLDALRDFKNGVLKRLEAADVEGHW
ncbi:MAG: dinitrogenase iron-molybdenum cofactor biosynthesis protein [Fibrobacter sp.]|nr:dinitrogenase iron-molybdenum cofactor biosynthesis protein [Fibrobacter sp.]